MRTVSELSTILSESMARLRDSQVGPDAREFVRKLRIQLGDDAPQDARLAMFVSLVAMETMLDKREAALRHSAKRATPAVV